jgi:hypothetical protein
MKKKSILIFIIFLVLLFLFVPILGSLYERFLGPTSVGFLGPSHPEYISGFFISYALFVSFFITVFKNNKKYKWLAILVGILFLLDIILGVWEDLVINLGAALVGWILGISVLAIKNKAKNKLTTTVK